MKVAGVRDVEGADGDADGVTAQVRGPEGGAPYKARARFVVGCDGPRSRVRELAGIAFPGTTYAEVNRLAHAVLAVEELEDGALRVPGLGPVRPGFTRTERGVFAFGRRSAGGYMIQTTEAEPSDVDDADSPLTLPEFGDSIRRVLGGPADRLRHQADALRLPGPPGRAVPPRQDPGRRRSGARVPGHRRGSERRHVRRGRPGLEMLQTQAQVALRRGGDDAAQALRGVLQELLLDEPAARRIGALIAGADLRYPTSGPDAHRLTGTCLPNLRIRTVSQASLRRRARY
jgi:hypothetical protein